MNIDMKILKTSLSDFGMKEFINRIAISGMK